VADDIDDLLAYAQSQGFIVEVDENGYRRIFTSAGDYITRYPATPGRKERRFREVVLALRKHGLVWPRPSRKELRSQRRKESS
jgi:hypothetical protein